MPAIPNIAKEGFPFIITAAIIGIILLPFSWITSIIFWILGLYFVYFFRDPNRNTPITDSSLIVAGADGVIAAIKQISETEITGIEEIRKATGQDKLFSDGAIRISIFLSLFDVHVNRAPISGKVTFLKYYPGKRYFTFTEKSSRYNQHNAICLSGATQCLIHQIVGPVTRRVVAWLKPGENVSCGKRIGIMKFGSRLDMYFPKSDIVVKIQIGERVLAGESVIATLKKE